MRIVVVVPTYNERETIGELLDSIEAEFLLIPKHEMRVLVVDGRSPDGTADVVRERAGKYGNIDLLVEREKRGLGMAYIEGMRYAIENLRAEAIMEFDGDFQHDPKDIKRLVAELDNGYDYIIGSRYVPGGSIPAEWALYRKLLSRFGSLFAKFVLDLPTADNTSGFKLARVGGFAEKLPLSEDKILSRHYAYKIHLLYEMHKMGARMKEVPIKFLEREHGSSKSDLGDIFESLRVVMRLRLRDLWGWRFFRFGLVGFSGFLVNAGFFELLAFTLDLLRPSIAAVVSGELSVLSNYTLNNFFTFTDRRANSVADFFKKLAMFNLSAVFILALQGGMTRLGEWVASESGNGIVIRAFFFASIILGLTVNYLVYTKIIWKKK
jgi:dolichol-phosphate mannosyltransferase